MNFNFKAEEPGAKIPTAHTQKSAGVDFYSNEEVTIWPGQAVNISTGISWNPDFISFGYKVALIIQSRSGFAFKHAIESSNAGVIDMDYVSTKKKKAIIHARLYNNGKDIFQVKKRNEDLSRRSPSNTRVQRYRISRRVKGCRRFRKF